MLDKGALPPRRRRLHCPAVEAAPPVHAARDAELPGTGAAGLAPIDGPFVLCGCRVITLHAGRPRARALRVADGRITHVLDEIPAALDGRRFDLGGAVVLPGLVDAHLHLAAVGEAARKLDLRGLPSAEAVARLVAETARSAPLWRWILGRGWNQDDWEDRRFPCAALLDAVAPLHPVRLGRIDGHAVWLNSRALAEAGITEATEDPPGGEIVRDESGEPTGVLVDRAIELVDRLVPPPSARQVASDVEAGCLLCNRAGLAGVHAMDVGAAELEALRTLEAEGRLSLRTEAFLVDREQAGIAGAPFREGLLDVAGVKLYADGALGSRGAALLSPYADRPDCLGLLLSPPEALAARAVGLHAQGWQVAIHAIGDLGNRTALDAIEATGGGDRRHRVEHVQVLDGDDLPRFAALGAIASVQPIHATSDMGWAGDRLGPGRLQAAYGWRRLLEAGATLASGSDAPIEKQDPWAAIHAAVTRQDRWDEPEGGWLPEQRLDVGQALRAATLGPAVAAHAEASLGSIRPGALADLCVVDQNPFAIPARDLRRVQNLAVIVDGRVAFDRDGRFQ